MRVLSWKMHSMARFEDIGSLEPLGLIGMMEVNQYSITVRYVTRSCRLGVPVRIREKVRFGGLI